MPETVALVPPETILLIEVDNFSQLKAQFKKTNFYKLYKDPAMAAFVDDFKAKWREKIKEIDNDIARAILDADVLPQGKVAFALALNNQPTNANEPTVLFISQWGQNISKIKEAVDKTVKKAIADGSHKKSEDYRGVAIETVVGEDETELIYCYIDDCMILATNPDMVKFVIAHIKGAAGSSLADSSDYTAAMKTVGPYHDIVLYVNIKQIVKTILARGGTAKTNTAMVNLGLDNVVSLACSLGLAKSPASSFHGKAVLKIEGAKKGLCKMLEADSAVIKPPRFIPASTYSVTFFNLNIKKAYDELYKILYAFSPQYAAMAFMPLLPPSPQGEPAVQLKTDVIDHLGSQIIIAQSVDKPFTESSTPQYLIALAVNNRTALEKSLSLVHSKIFAANNPEARRELLGHTIYLLDFSGMLPFFSPGMTPMFARRAWQADSEPTAPQMPTLAFTITDTHLLFGVESAVERAVRTLSSGGSASIKSGWFNIAKSAVPSVVGLCCLQNDATASELLWSQLTSAKRRPSSGIATTGPAPFQLGQYKIGELVNFNLLPEFDTVRKYFWLSAFYGVSRPDGFFFEFKDVKPTAD
ncbi:MAG: hypothetical protein DRP62_01620 [Planctomycetota bacterium]|nr:MAG: hypothetical protein DRP62_01620 [Planctomycetota bacterium]